MYCDVHGVPAQKAKAGRERETSTLPSTLRVDTAAELSVPLEPRRSWCQRICAMSPRAREAVLSCFSPRTRSKREAMLEVCAGGEEGARVAELKVEVR